MEKTVKSKRKKSKHKDSEASTAALNAQCSEKPTQAPTRKRRKPEVIIFNDPTTSSNQAASSYVAKKSKYAFMSNNVAKIHTFATLPSAAAVPASDAIEDPSDLDMNKAAEEILRLGASQMQANTRRRWEQRRLLQLGAKASPREKMPLAVLQGRRKKVKERSVKKAEYERTTGITRGLGTSTFTDSAVAKVAPLAAKKRNVKGGHWVDKSSVDDARFKKGVLRVDKKLLS
eukprot:m.1096210 g.1096210  ORF g.1096210 m.1096210 type:complete len:231 (+) comp24307_c0_seq5:126-818(+)